VDSLAPIREHTVSSVFKEGRDKDPSMFFFNCTFPRAPKYDFFSCVLQTAEIKMALSTLPDFALEAAAAAAGMVGGGGGSG
jgi:hypothetical protein